MRQPGYCTIVGIISGTEERLAMRAGKITIIAAAALAMMLTLAFTLAGCNGTQNQSSEGAQVPQEATDAEITTGYVNVVKDTNFNGIMLDMTEDEFADLGFELGDSVDIVIDDTMYFENVPYYSGYFAATGELLLVSYPGEPHPNFRRAQGTLWDDIDVTENSRIQVTLRERGAYLDTQEALDMTYSNNRADFTTDEEFANFRSLTGGSLKQNLVYRSASPIDNTYLRASCANKLVEQTGIAYSLDLSDNQDEFAAEAAEAGSSCQYYIDLQAKGCVGLLDMNTSFGSSANRQLLATALYNMCQHQGPYLVHCVEGKDRTGFVCMLIEALAGASEEELIRDYIITYDNYYNITKANEPAKYDAVVNVKAKDMITTLRNAADSSRTKTPTLKECAEDYLKAGGLSAEQIAQIEATLCA